MFSNPSSIGAVVGGTGGMAASSSSPPSVPISSYLIDEVRTIHSILSDCEQTISILHEEATKLRGETQSKTINSRGEGAAPPSPPEHVVAHLNSVTERSRALRNELNNLVSRFIV